MSTVGTPDPESAGPNSSGPESGNGWLSDVELLEVRRRLPILYVEAVPVRLDGLGQVTEVGILLRASVTGEMEVGS